MEEGERLAKIRIVPERGFRVVSVGHLDQALAAGAQLIATMVMEQGDDAQTLAYVVTAGSAQG